MLVEAAGPRGWGVYIWDPSAPFQDLRPAEGRAEAVLTPGFVDIHIHGAFGIDFMTASSAALTALADQLDKLGYEAFLPTTVTASVEDVSAALKNLPDDPRMPGFHLEGPFISHEFPGAQPEEFIIDLGDPAWDPVFDDRRLKVITLAPERPGALGLIRRLAMRGVRVSFGHTDATFAQCGLGFDHGARGTTHTYNAMRGLHHREAGTVGYALLAEDMTCELIYDRIHVCREAAEVLVRSKGPTGVVAVSDSSLATGLPPGSVVDMWGHRCITGDGTVRLASSGALAGSAVTLLDIFANLWEDFGPEIACRACSHNPRHALGWSSPPRRLLLFDTARTLKAIYDDQP